MRGTAAVEDAGLRDPFGGRAALAREHSRAVDRGNGWAGLARTALERIGKDEAQATTSCQPATLSREAMVSLHGNLLGKACPGVRDADRKRGSMHRHDGGGGRGRSV